MVKNVSSPSRFDFAYSSSKPKNRLKKTLTAVLATFFIALTVSGAATASNVSPAYADDVVDIACPVYAGDNDDYIEWARLGGMTTAQIEYIQTVGLGETAAVRDVPELTFPEQFSENMVFTNWVPHIPQDEDVEVYSNVEGSSWGGFNGSGSTSGLPVTSTPQPDFIDFLNDRANCKVDIGFANAGTVMPNILLSVGKFIYDITDNIYVAAMGGSTNITNVVALDTEAGNVENFDEIFITDEDNNESWSIQVANVIEEALVGQDGEGGLYNTLYLNFLLPLIFVAAIVIIVNLLRTKAVRALTGFVWIIVVIALGVAVLQAPMAAPKFIDGLVGTVGNTAAEAITETASPSEEGSTTCSIEDPTATISDIQARTVSCRIWENTIFKAWERGQFGDSSFDDEASQDFIRNMYGPEAVNAAYIVAEEPSNRYDAFFTSSGQEYNAIIGIIAVSSVGFFVLGNSILLMAYQISMLLLIFTAPIFFIAGIVPSTMGRGVFLRWLELIVGILVKKLVVTILLAVFLAMFFIIASIEFPSLLIQSVVFAVITYIGFTQRSKIIEMFTGKINFGGDKSVNVGSSVESVADKSAVVAMGATAVGTGLALKAAGKGALSAGKAGTQFASNKAGSARATSKLNKMRQMGVSDAERTQFAEASAAKYGTTFEKQFVNKDGKINIKDWESQQAFKDEGRDLRKAERKAKSVIKKDEQRYSSVTGLEYKAQSKESVAEARNTLKKASNYRGREVIQKTENKLGSVKSDTKRAAVWSKAKNEISQNGDDATLKEFGSRFGEEEVNKNTAAKAREDAKQFARAKKAYKNNSVTRRKARASAYGFNGEENIRSQQES